MVDEIDPSPEFKNFGLQFFQDIHLSGDTFEEILDFVLRPFEGEERARLRGFLDKALDARVSDADLQRLWNATPSEIDFIDAKGLQTVLRAARDRLCPWKARRPPRGTTRARPGSRRHHNRRAR